MRQFLWRSFGLMALLALAIALLVPREPVDTDISFNPNILSGDLDTYLAASESQFDDITRGVEKRIVWAGQPGEVTEYSVLYIHGFSATSEEIRPVPDDVAEALGANLFFTRLTGHGRSSMAMADPNAGDWLEDTAEALAIGRRLGRKVVVIATSTGGTATAIAATDPEQMKQVAGIVFVSPNFRVNAPTAVILEWPFARLWGLLLAGAERGIDPQNEGHAKYWTTLYPSQALVPLSALVRHARKTDYSAVTTPALFMFSDEDAVVSAEATRAITTRWGAEATISARELGPEDDAFRHIIAGDILSPNQTAETVELMLEWIGEL